MTAAGLVIACFAAVGCGSSSSSSSSASASASTSHPAAPSIPFSSTENSVPSSYPKPKPGNFRLAYLNPEAGNQFLNTLGQSMALEAKMLGGSFIQLHANNSVETQVSQFNELIAQKVNGIAVYPLDIKALAPDVARARKAGIHVVTVEVNLNSASPAALDGYESQVWYGRDKAAYLTAQYMAQHLPAGSSLGTIGFIAPVPALVYTIQRDGYWAQKFGLKIAGNAANPTDDIAGGETAGTTLINKYPGIKGVMGYNDPSAIGAYTAARSAGVTGLIFAGANGGSDALAAIKSGSETFSIKFDVPGIGKDLTWSLYDLQEGVKIPPVVRAAPPALVDKANVNNVVTWAQQLKNEYPNG